MRYALIGWLAIVMVVSGFIGAFAVQDGQAEKAFSGAALAVGNAFFLVALLVGAIP